MGFIMEGLVRFLHNSASKRTERIYHEQFGSLAVPRYWWMQSCCLIWLKALRASARPRSWVSSQPAAPCVSYYTAEQSCSQKSFQDCSSCNCAGTLCSIILVAGPSVFNVASVVTWNHCHDSSIPTTASHGGMLVQSKQARENIILFKILPPSVQSMWW